MPHDTDITLQYPELSIKELELKLAALQFRADYNLDYSYRYSDDINQLSAEIRYRKRLEEIEREYPDATTWHNRLSRQKEIDRAE